MTRTTSRSFLDKSKAQSSETPRPDKTVCGFLFNRLPAAFNHPPSRDNKRFFDLQRRTVYVSTPSLLPPGACALWVNKRFTDAFTSNKESACFYWTPYGECFAHLLLLFRLLQCSHLFSLPRQVFYRGRQMNALSLSARRM